MNFYSQSPRIDTNATTGILWSVKAYHAERLKSREADHNEKARSKDIIGACNVELARRLGADHIFAERV